VQVITEETSYGETLGWIQLADCYLSLHRSEGYGYGMAEALALGTPVIATNYSGSLSFTTDANSYLVQYTETEIKPAEYFYYQQGMFWAEPDVSKAVESLLEIRFGARSKIAIENALGEISKVATTADLARSYAACLNSKIFD
jgi:glycosyltransferase involved in cell wall biosynthesis